MEKGKGGRSSRKRKTEVPGQALGYALQYTRMTQMLLQAPEGSFCSLEVLDDVAEQHPDNGTRLVQSKSALTGNPVADRASSLWKTLSNWVESSALSGFDIERTQFEIYVSRPVDGGIVRSFVEATTLDAARAAIEQARKFFWGDKPGYPMRSEVAKEIAPFVERVFEADPQRVSWIIRNFHLNCGSGSPQADIESIIRADPVSSSKVRDIADHLCGIVKRRVDELLEMSLPAIISRDEFANWYRAYVRKIDRDMVLLSRAQIPSEKEVHGFLPRLFVQQLDLIGLTYEDKLEAVSDYFMAAADRTEWAARGEVDETSFSDLDDSLKRSWKNKRRSCEIQHADKADEHKGQVLYSECMDMRVPLQAMQPPGHFIPGCLHRLSDDLQVGWHPTFEFKLQIKKAA